MNKVLFYFFCFLIPFENTVLGLLGGAFTKSAGIIFIPYFTVLLALFFIRNPRSYEIRFISVYFVFCVYSFCTYFLYIQYDQFFVFDRGLRFLLLSLPPCIIFLYALRQDLDVIKYGVFICFSVVIFSYVINVVAPDIINSKSIIQSTAAFSSDRYRGFTLEASTFGFQLVLSSLLVLIYIKKNPLYFPILIAACISTTSKGALICLLISCSCYYFIGNKSKLKYPLLIFSLIIGYFIFIEFLLPSFANDIAKYTTVTTRGSVMLLSIVTMFHNPLGTGFFGYLPAFYSYGEETISLYVLLSPFNNNFSEVINYFIVGETESVGTKSFLFDWIIFMGLPFFIGYLYINYFMLINFYRSSLFIEFITTLFLFLSLSAFVPIETRYIAPFAYAILFSRIIFKGKGKGNVQH